MVGRPWCRAPLLGGGPVLLSFVGRFSLISGSSIDPRKIGDVTRKLAPSTGPEMLLFLVLSLSAGVCEEFVFRGYLQQQLVPIGSAFGSASFSPRSFWAVHMSTKDCGSIAHRRVWRDVWRARDASARIANGNDRACLARFDQRRGADVVAALWSSHRRKIKRWDVSGDFGIPNAN